VDVFVHNETLLPPRFQNNLSFRYFVNLSEYYHMGLTVDDVTPMLNYGAFGGELSQFIAWNEAAHIYYVEGSWPAIDIYGNVEMQFALSNYNTDVWDSTNDYSYEGLNSSESIVSEKIPIYQDGVLLYGVEPPDDEEPEPEPEPEPIVGDIYVTYLVRSSWDTGATVEITVTNNASDDITGWTLVWDFPDGQEITSLWTGTYTQDGASVTVQGETHNYTIPKDGSISFGFNLSHSGTNNSPTTFLLNDKECIVE
jgi:cellulase/cellobiase CelA1